MFSLKLKLVYSGKIYGSDQYRALGWRGGAECLQSRHSQHLIQLPSSQPEIGVESLTRKLVSRGLAACIREGKAHGCIYTAYVPRNLCHVCLCLFPYVSFKVVSSCVQCVGGFCF